MYVELSPKERALLVKLVVTALQQQRSTDTENAFTDDEAGALRRLVRLLEPQGAAYRASVEDQVFWKGRNYEIVHAVDGSGLKKEHETDRFIIAPVEDDGADPLTWPWIERRELTWLPAPMSPTTAPVPPVSTHNAGVSGNA